jgi:KaiC/GvpD/RAD55 family RecA-like ATPase
LISHGFVRETDVGDHRKYRITERGLEFIETFKKMSKFFAALEEPVDIRMPEPSPIVLPNRIKTGYPELDAVLYGGIPENYSVILTSPSCEEKESIVTEFLSSGVKEQQATFFVTTDVTRANMLAQRFQSDLHLFVCNSQADNFLESSPNLIKLAGAGNLTSISIALISALRALDSSSGNRRRACIDIVSDVLLEHHAIDTRKWLSRLIPEMKAKRFTILAIVNPYMHSSEEVQAILGLFEGEIDLYEKGSGEDARRFLKIRKMLGQRYLNSSFPIKREESER